MRPALLALAAALALLPRAASALHVRADVGPLAWSADGRSVLLADRHFGPEGGGSLTYLVVSAAAPAVSQFEVSSDFSPGSGSRPQAVPGVVCRRRLMALATLLGEKGFAGVEVETGGCRERQRDELVRVAPAQAEAMRGAALPPGGAKGWRVTAAKGGVRIAAPGGKGERLAARSADAAEAYLSPGGLLLVLADVVGERHLLGVLALEPDGALRRLLVPPGL